MQRRRMAWATVSCFAASLSTALLALSPAAEAHGDLTAGPPPPVDLVSALQPIVGSLPLLGGLLGSILPAPSPPPAPALANPTFTAFESGQVRPLALSPDGKLLFATNTPDSRVEVYRIGASGALRHRASVPVGLEPVAIAARTSSEIWIVNHLSDSVSIVEYDDALATGRVVRTLLVGDEPRDIVFAGPGNSRAFVTTAHRGQNAPFDPQLTTPSVGRADVWVFDALALGSSFGGAPITIVNLFSDTPRALAVTPDGSRVYAAAFHSGNRTSGIVEFQVTDGGELLGGVPGPRTNVEGYPAPEVGVIVKHDGQHWRDAAGHVHDDQMRMTLADRDVFAIDANANPPRLATGAGSVFTGVGTVLFNMAVNPVSGAVYVSNTEANNLEQFEGAGELAGSSIRGHLAESRITVLKNGAVAPRHLNKHIDYDDCCAPLPNDENEKSLAFPNEMAVTPDGKTLFVSAMGSNKIGMFRTAQLENDTFAPSAASHVKLTGGGPTGLVFDAKRNRVFVLTRFDNGISVIDPSAKTEASHVTMFNPEPEKVVRGRRLLYDASISSSHGDSACASCHIFGDFDSLAWDLGNPDGEVVHNPGPFMVPAGGGIPVTNPELPTGPLPISEIAFHPIKGPMTTQSLRGMKNAGPMHWRGDRTGGQDEASQQPDEGSYDEVAAFKKFNGAFPGLLGRAGMLTDEDMQAFADFMLEVTYPPNPIRNLDNSLTPQQQEGLDFFFTNTSDFASTCQDCHKLDKDGNRGYTDRPGFFGTSGEASFEFEPQFFKIPHLRNVYQKVGRFGMAEHPLLVPQDHQQMGDQVRGFGFLHDGSFDSMFRFMSLVAFTHPEGNKTRRSVEDFLFVFDSNLAPIVGQQVTLDAGSGYPAHARAALLVARSAAGECEVIARAEDLGYSLDYLYAGGDAWVPNESRQPVLAFAQLRDEATSGTGTLTLTCVPPGSGQRMALDRDLDGALDGDEALAGTDPADPTDLP